MKEEEYIYTVAMAIYRSSPQFSNITFEDALTMARAVVKIIEAYK
jgi:hypothetical protein